MERVTMQDISEEMIYNIGGSVFSPTRETPEDIYDLAIHEGMIRFVDENGKFAAKRDVLYYLRCNWPA